MEKSQVAMETMPLVTVIIPTLNRAGPLKRVLLYFRDSEPFRDFELIIIDQSDALDPDVMDIVAGSGSRFRHEYESFRQLTRARNRGVELARGDIIVFSDDDVEPWPGLLEKYVKIFQDPAIHAATGPFLLPGETIRAGNQLSAAEMKALMGQKAMAFNVDFSFSALYAQGGNSAYRRAVFRVVGGFDENFVGNAWGEDYEFSYRVRRRVGPICYNPEVGVLHHAETSGGSRNAARPQYISDFVRNSIYRSVRIDEPLIALPWIIWVCYRRLVLNRDLLRRGGLIAGTLAVIKGMHAAAKLLIRRGNRTFE